jgi:hypothetical protein
MVARGQNRTADTGIFSSQNPTQTCLLIKRSYMQTFNVVKVWQTRTILRRYNDCLEYKGDIPKDVL